MQFEIPDDLVANNILICKAIQLLNTGIFKSVTPYNEFGVVAYPKGIQGVRLFLSEYGTMTWQKNNWRQYCLDTISFEEVLELAEPDKRVLLLFHLDLFAG